MTTTTTPTASAAGQFTIAGELPVNRMGFGAMRLTGQGVWGEPADADEAKRVLHRAIELGVNFIDTADAYGPDVSERLIAETLYPYPQDLVIATKGGLERQGPGQWNPNGSPEHLRDALEGSLRRLRLECIDQYQLHRPDPNVPFEESVGTLADEQRAGKIRFIGLSNVNNEQLVAAQKEARIVSVQNRYNIKDRASDDMLAKCDELGMMFLPWGPLGQGNLSEDEAVSEIAKAHAISESQVALAWLLSRSESIVLIPGTSKVQHLEENVAAAQIELTPAELESLSR